MKTVLMADPIRYSAMPTVELRETFLLRGPFEPDSMNLAYIDLDRAVIGGVVPVTTAITLRIAARMSRERNVGLRHVARGPGSFGLVANNSLALCVRLQLSQRRLTCKRHRRDHSRDNDYSPSHFHP
jgi:hypothetical protein